MAEARTLYGIQVLRGVAAILVVACHVGALLADASPIGNFELGGFGVDLFFPISGLVIYFASSSASWQVFLLKRFVRVVPIYWLFTGLKLLVLLLVPRLVPGYVLTPWHTLASFLFVPAHNYRGEAVPLITVGWTLDFEIYFYFVCALALALAPRPRFAAVVASTIAVLSLVFLPVQPAPSFAPLLLFNPICVEFLAGLGIGYALKRGLRAPWYVSCALVGVAVAWLLLFHEPPGGDAYRVTRVLAWGVPGALLVLATVMLERQVPFAKLRLANVLGNASYAIYLSHQATLPLIGKLVQRTVHVPGWLPFALILLACTALGVVTHYLIERPLTAFATGKLQFALARFSAAPDRELRSAYR